MRVLIWLTIFVLIGSGDGYTVTSDTIHTWWHNKSEYNDDSPVQDSYVRCSTIYNVQVTAAPDANQTNVFDSFVYMSIPRGGRQKWGYRDADGAEFANASSLTMSWSTFQYLIDVWVIVQLRNVSAVITSIDNITIRPTNLNFKKELINSRTVRVLVPYRAAGYRFADFFKNISFVC